MRYLRKFNENVENLIHEIDSRNYYDLIGSLEKINYRHVVNMTDEEKDYLDNIKYEVSWSLDKTMTDKLGIEGGRTCFIPAMKFMHPRPSVNSDGKSQWRYSICKVDDDWFLIMKWFTVLDERSAGGWQYFKCDSFDGLKQFIEKENLI